MDLVTEAIGKLADNLKITALQNILKALKAGKITARIGILGSGHRTDGNVTNAQVGAAHEFGTTKLPVRSFLRMPITTRLQKELESSGAFTPDALKKVVTTKSMIPWVEKMAIAAVAVVLDAFDTQGFGQWKPVTPETMARKKVKQILTETQQLRNSVTYDIQGGT